MSTATTRNDGAQQGAARSLTRLGLVLVGALATVPACGGKSRSGTDSNTHWYQRCATDDDCDALSCSCGMCTQRCEASSDCSDLGTRAECATVSSCEQSTSSASVCLAQCEGNDDCATLGQGLLCDNGHCLLDSEGTAGGGGAGGNAASTATAGRPASGPDTSGAGGSSASTGGSTGLGGTDSTTGGFTESGGSSSAAGSSPASGGSSSARGTAAGGSISATGGTWGRGGASGSEAASGSASAMPGGSGGHGGVPEGGGTAGAAAEGGMDPISSGGAAGSGSNQARLVLDTESLTFFQLPIGSIRFAVAGYDPTARVCATLVWGETASDSTSGAQCDVDADRTPYVFVETDTDGPCDGWDYAGNTETVDWSGCSGFAESRETNVNLIDAQVEVEGPLFTGTIVADNRPSGGVSFGFQYIGDAPQSVYVQSVGMTGTPDWLAVTRDGAAVQIFDPCDLPTCGTEEGVCGASIPEVHAVTESSSAGSVYYQWDGLVRTADNVNDCWLEAPAAPGTYQVEICYGFGTRDGDFGSVVADPVCVTQEFTYPTDRVVVTVNASG